jgi:hypothetical protein
MRRVLMGTVVAATACAVPSLDMTGRLQAAADDVVGVGGAEVVVRTFDTSPWSSVRTNVAGDFSIPVPVQAEIFVEFRADGVASPIAFGGTTGVADPFSVPLGTFFVVDYEEEADLRDRFAGCPDVEAPGMITGDVRILVSGDPLLDPLDPSASVRVELDDGTLIEACYLNEEGTAYDPGATTVGPAGVFAIFGVQGKPFTLVPRRVVGEASVQERYRGFVPEDGVFSERPVYLPL